MRFSADVKASFLTAAASWRKVQCTMDVFRESPKVGRRLCTWRGCGSIVCIASPTC